MKPSVWKLFSTVTLLILTTMTMAQEPSEIFSHTVLILPYNLKSEEPWGRVIQTQEKWQSFFGEILDDNQLTPFSITLPKIDFKKYQLIIGGLGIRPSGGHKVSVASVFELDDSILIDVFDIRPGKNCISAAVMTYPSTAILVKKTTKPIEFNVSRLILECPF